MQTPVMVIAAGAGRPPGIVPEVPFPPLGMTGIAIATRGRRAWELLLTAVFAAAHLSVLLGLRNATPAAASESLADFETATYLDIPPPTAVAVAAPGRQAAAGRCERGGDGAGRPGAMWSGPTRRRGSRN